MNRDPWKILLLCLFFGIILLAEWAVPAFVHAFIIACAFGLTLEPSVKRSWLKYLIPTAGHGSVVMFWLCIALITCGTIGWYYIPSLSQGIADNTRDLPGQVPVLRTALGQWLETKRSLVEKIAPGVNMDYWIAYLKDHVPEYAQIALTWTFQHITQGAIKSAFGIGMIFITFVVFCFFVAEYVKIANGALKAAERYWPNKVEESQKLVRLFQKYARGFFGGMSINMVIFAIAYITILKVAGLSWPKALALGSVLGMFSCIPKIGGVATKAILIPICLVNFGITDKSMWVFVASLAVYFIEVNFLTPRIIGQHVKIPSIIIMFNVIVGTVLFGAIAGVPLAIFTLALGKALWDMAINNGIPQE